VFLLAVILAASPIPSKVITAKVTTGWDKTGKIVISDSAKSESKLFEDTKDVLASITSANSYNKLCSLEMTTV
jgi:hypothetical protein